MAGRENINPQADGVGKLGRTAARWLEGWLQRLALRQGGAEPGAGVAGNVQVYAKADGHVYEKDAAGVERRLTTNVDGATLDNFPKFNAAGDLQDSGIGASAVQTKLLRKTAGEILNGGRAVFVGADGKLYMADNTVLAEVKAVVGISEGASIAEASAPYVVSGSVTEAGWAWTPGARIYFDNLGMLVDTAPVTGHHRSVGVADTATSILVNVGEVIAR